MTNLHSLSILSHIHSNQLTLNHRTKRSHESLLPTDNTARLRQRTSSTTSIQTIRPVDNPPRKPSILLLPAPTKKEFRARRASLSHSPNDPPIPAVTSIPSPPPSPPLRPFPTTEPPPTTTTHPSKKNFINTLTVRTRARSSSTTSLVSPRPTSSSWDYTTLPASSLALSLSFPRHFEFWDLADDTHVTLHGTLSLYPKEPVRWVNKPLNTPDVGVVDVRCHVVPVPTPFSDRFDPDGGFVVEFVGVKREGGGFVDVDGESDRDVKGNEREKEKDGNEKKEKEKEKEKIKINPSWERTYTLPTPAPQGVRGWKLAVSIPIPTRLFVKKETRTFRVVANVWIGDVFDDLDDDGFVEGDVGDVGDKEEDEEGGALGGTGVVCVSHLRRDRFMDNLL